MMRTRMIMRMRIRVRVRHAPRLREVSVVETTSAQTPSDPTAAAQGAQQPHSSHKGSAQSYLVPVTGY